MIYHACDSLMHTDHATLAEAPTFHLQFALTLFSPILVDDLAGVNTRV